MKAVALRALDIRLSVCRLDADAGLPDWFSLEAPFAATLRRGDELSLVCREDMVPPGVVAERGWRALEVAGPLDLSLTGILAALAAALADAGVPLFALATYDTDVLLVPGARLGEAIAALRDAGHEVNASVPD